MKKLSSTVFVLGMASFFTDLSSEMIYPLLPVFLSTVLGAGALQLGIIEGIAESTASLTKLISGLWTDRAARRKPFIVAGYSLAGLARPLIGLAQSWPAVLALRFTDRVGKGIRTSPRDAMIADVTEPGLRGRAYGFHRSMDHAGAVTGPAVAAYLLWELHVPLRVIFLWALIPSLVVIALLLTQLKENSREIPPPAAPISWALWNTLPANFKFFLLSVFVFFARQFDGCVSALKTQRQWRAGRRHCRAVVASSHR
jgi:predicted MFS family arabinose efflux permease